MSIVNLKKMISLNNGPGTNLILNLILKINNVRPLWFKLVMDKACKQFNNCNILLMTFANMQIKPFLKMELTKCSSLDKKNYQRQFTRHI